MTSQLRKLARLPWSDRLLLARAWCALFFVRLAMSLGPWRFARRLVCGALPPRARRENPPPAERIIWAVKRARRLVPRATCLVQAAAARVLLARAGHDAHLHLGVTRSTVGEFEAHAWLESHGRIVVGRVPHFERYARLNR